MSQAWAERQRRTNDLVREIADYLSLKSANPSPPQLYGLCKLTWITNSYEGGNASYVWSTKIPALEAIFNENFKNSDLTTIANHLAEITGKQRLLSLVLAETGFTNFYKAYRNTAKSWLTKNFNEVLPLFKRAYSLKSDSQARALALALSNLDGIPKGNNSGGKMRPEYLLTPAFFALDPRLRFPLINGNKGVQNLLSKLKVANSSLQDQLSTMTSLYGIGGIKDAADLDQAGYNLPDFVTVGAQTASKKFLQRKAVVGKRLPLKDEADVESIQSAKTTVNKRVHNKLTNKLLASLGRFTLTEGLRANALYDVMVSNFDGHGTDLLIEVKSSCEPPHIRMAIGQLANYWFSLKKTQPWKMAILLPSSPSREMKDLLSWLNIGLLWFSVNQLKTEDAWLLPLTY